MFFHVKEQHVNTASARGQLLLSAVEIGIVGDQWRMLGGREGLAVRLREND